MIFHYGYLYFGSFGKYKMQVIKTYSYPNTVVVQFVDPTLWTGGRNRQVYSRTIKVYQGIDNPIQIVSLNQDQKSIDLTGYSLVVSIQDPVNFVTVANYPVTYTNPGDDITKGRGSFIFDKATIDSLEQRFYKLTVQQVNSITNEANPMYIDDNYGVPLDLQILPAFYSSMAPSPYINESVIDAGTI
jgi:hypothetical protein